MEHYEVVEEALFYIEKNIENTLSVDSVSSEFNLSKYYFHRLFSAIIGCSLSQYVLSRRLNASLALIQNQNLSLTDIAYRLNFGTQSSFTRAFKRQFGITPSLYRGKNETIPQEPIPPVVKRPIKNINGDIVTDFTLQEFNPVRVCGIAFEVDLATGDYKEKIHAHSRMLLNSIDKTINGPCYVIYSNCKPNSTSFNVLFGIPYDIQIDKPYYFTNDLPQIFCAKFNYFGDLLDIGDVFVTDFFRFLRISKQERETTDIELIQVFDNVHNLESAYHIYVPVKKDAVDLEC